MVPVVYATRKVVIKDRQESNNQEMQKCNFRYFESKKSIFHENFFSMKPDFCQFANNLISSRKKCQNFSFFPMAAKFHWKSFETFVNAAEGSAKKRHFPRMWPKNPYFCNKSRVDEGRQKSWFFPKKGNISVAGAGLRQPSKKLRQRFGYRESETAKRRENSRFFLKKLFSLAGADM